MTDRPPRLFAISDLHLPGSYDKSMDLFGAHWQDHFAKISQDWKLRVAEDDVVLIPGDISWAMHLEEAMNDLEQIGDLPGQKIMIKGNHDYWWNAVGRIRNQVHPSIHIIQNDAILLGNVLVCGTRGWIHPGIEPDDAKNKKIYDREIARMTLSLQAARRLGVASRFIAMCHYPPFGPRGESSQLTQLLEEYKVDDVVYGHLHGGACNAGFSGEYRGIRYWLASCDCVGFQLVDMSI